MGKIKVKLIGSGSEKDPLRVNLPNYQMLDNGMIEVPDDELTDDKREPSKERIRQKYRGQQKWDRPDVGDDV